MHIHPTSYIKHHRWYAKYENMWVEMHKTRRLLTSPHLSRCPFQRWTATPWKLHLAPFQAPGDQSCSKSPPSGPSGTQKRPAPAAPTFVSLLPEISQIDQSPTFLSNGIIVIYCILTIVYYNYIYYIVIYNDGPVYQHWDGTSFILATCETEYGQKAADFLTKAWKRSMFDPKYTHHHYWSSIFRHPGRILLMPLLGPSSTCAVRRDVGAPLRRWTYHELQLQVTACDSDVNKQHQGSDSKTCFSIVEERIPYKPSTQRFSGAGDGSKVNI